MSTDEQMPEMIDANIGDPRIQAALDELRGMILAQFPDVQFRVEHGEDPDAIWLVAIADIEDLDEVTGVVLSRIVDMQVDEGLPVFVVGDWPPARVREYLRQSPLPIDPAMRLPILTA